MIRLKTDNLKSAGSLSLLGRIFDSNLMFGLLLALISLMLFFGWRYMHQKAQARAEIKAAAVAAANRARLAALPPSPPAVTGAIPVTETASNLTSNPPATTGAIPVTEPPATNNPASRMAEAQARGEEKSKSADNSPKSADPTDLNKTNPAAAGKTEPVSFADSLMAVITPSAKGSMIQPEMPRMHAPPATKPVKRMSLAPATAKPANPEEEKPMTPEQKRLKLAQKRFGEVMSLATKYRDIYGFKSDDDLESATIGDPIPVCVVTQPGRTVYTGQPVKSLLQPAEEWLYPIVLDNRVRYMVQVRREGEDFVLGEGSRALAMAYEKIMNRWPASKGYHPQLVLLPNTPFYYFNIPELSFENITDTSRMFDLNPDIAPATVQLGSWR